jgi:transposase-like protein
MNTPQEGTSRSRRTGEEVRQLVSAFQASGLRASEFCRRHGLALSTLRRNLKRQRVAQGKAEAGVRFVAVKVNGAAQPSKKAPAPARLEVVLAAGRRIGVAPGFDVATLGRLVRALEGL